MLIERKEYIKNEKKILLILTLFSLVLGFISAGLFTNIALICCFLFFLFNDGEEIAICSYIYISIWSKFTTLPIFSGASLISLLLAIWLIMNMAKNKTKIGIWDLGLIIFLIFEGANSLFITKSGTSGFFLCSDAVLVMYINSVISIDEKKRANFWRIFFLFIYISTIVSLIWGVLSYLRGNVATLYLNGEYVKRLTTTVGTDRSCMIYCASLIYPLFYLNNVYTKWISVLVLVIALMMTFSVTAITCLSVFTFIYLLYKFKDDKSKKRMRITVLVFAIIIYIIYVWNFGSNFSVVNTIIERLKLIIYRINIGDFGKATSGRTEIIKDYWAAFKDMSIFEKIFGSGITSLKSSLNIDVYSHNTYIDMLLYFGILPYIFIICRLINSFIKKRKYPEYIELTLLKLPYLITAASVSTFTNNYWWIIFIL